MEWRELLTDPTGSLEFTGGEMDSVYLSPGNKTTSDSTVFYISSR
jgi:hypothetical protein